MANEDDMLCQYMKSRAEDIEASKISQNDKKACQADVAMLVQDKKKTRIAAVLFKTVYVSKSILETKWAQGSTNYAVPMEAIETTDQMRWFAFKAYRDSDAKWHFIHSALLKSWLGTFEKLNRQSVVLVPLAFVEDCSMPFDELNEHYHTEIEKLAV